VVIIIGCLNRLLKNHFNYFVPSLLVIIFIVEIIVHNILIIHNDDESLQDPILMVRIPRGTRKDFSENY
jgi:hypothetical protein